MLLSAIPAYTQSFTSQLEAERRSEKALVWGGDNPPPTTMSADSEHRVCD
jgi:hypothetical protein